MESAADAGARTALPLTALVRLAALTVAWGVNFPAMKVALGEIEPWTFRALTLAIGGAGLLGIARAGGHSLAVPRREWRPLCAAALLNITGWHMLAAYALMDIGGGRAAIIGYTMPLWALLLGRLVLREPLTPARLLALLLGLTGLGVLIGPELASLSSAPVGTLLMLGAAASWAAGTVVVKRVRWTIPTVLLTAWQVILGAVPIALGMLVAGSPPSPGRLGAGAIAAAAYTAFVAIIFCHHAWFRTVRLLPSSVAAISTLGIPIVGVLSSGLLLGEPVGPREVAALGLVVPALGLVLVGPGAPGKG